MEAEKEKYVRTGCPELIRMPPGVRES